jgi:HRDC domain
MKSQQLIAYILIAIGALALLARFTGGAGWLWVALVATGLLWGYTSQKSYGLLIAGSIVMGVAVGLLLENDWGWNGAFLISLGIGFMMIDRIETRQNRWPLYVGGILAAFGLVVGLLDSGFLQSFGFALVLIAVGAFLLTRGKKDDWVKVEPSSYQPSYQPTPAKQAQAQDSVVSDVLSPDVLSPDVARPDVLSPDAVVSDATINNSLDDPTDSIDITANNVTANDPSTIDPSTIDPSTMGTIIPEASSAESSLPLMVDTELYKRLEQWRRETARTEDRAAYLILTNETMQQIAAVKPQTMDDLLAIKGIGEIKLERYGEVLLTMIRQL